jgi:hypothetical protein
MMCCNIPLHPFLCCEIIFSSLLYWPTYHLKSLAGVNPATKSSLPYLGWRLAMTMSLRIKSTRIGDYPFLANVFFFFRSQLECASNWLMGHPQPLYPRLSLPARREYHSPHMTLILGLLCITQIAPTGLLIYSSISVILQTCVGTATYLPILRLCTY